MTKKIKVDACNTSMPIEYSLCWIKKYITLEQDKSG